MFLNAAALPWALITPSGGWGRLVLAKHNISDNLVLCWVMARHSPSYCGLQQGDLRPVAS